MTLPKSSFLFILTSTLIFSIRFRAESWSSKNNAHTLLDIVARRSLHDICFFIDFSPSTSSMGAPTTNWSCEVLKSNLIELVISFSLKAKVLSSENWFSLLILVKGVVGGNSNLAWLFRKVLLPLFLTLLRFGYWFEQRAYLFFLGFKNKVFIVPIYVKLAQD